LWNRINKNLASINQTLGSNGQWVSPRTNCSKDPKFDSLVEQFFYRPLLPSKSNTRLLESFSIENRSDNKKSRQAQPTTTTIKRIEAINRTTIKNYPTDTTNTNNNNNIQRFQKVWRREHSLCFDISTPSSKMWPLSINHCLGIGLGELKIGCSHVQSTPWICPIKIGRFKSKIQRLKSKPSDLNRLASNSLIAWLCQFFNCKSIASKLDPILCVSYVIQNTTLIHGPF
jgi:hypothetical protein